MPPTTTPDLLPALELSEQSIAEHVQQIAGTVDGMGEELAAANATLRKLQTTLAVLAGNVSADTTLAHNQSTALANVDEALAVAKSSHQDIQARVLAVNETANATATALGGLPPEGNLSAWAHSLNETFLANLSQMHDTLERVDSLEEGLGENASTLLLRLARRQVDNSLADAALKTANTSATSFLAQQAKPSQQGNNRSSAPDRGERLLFLIRTGGKDSQLRMAAVNSTWAKGLAPEEIWLMHPDPDCDEHFGDNHGVGLSCLEAKSEMAIVRSRRQFDWLVVVDDDVYVQVPHLRKTLGSLSLRARATYGVPGCGRCDDDRGAGFCGGGGYVVSRQNLLTMVGCDHACSARASVSTASNCSLDACVADGRYLERFVGGINADWCDVRFGCVASTAGLAPTTLDGLYPWAFESKEDEELAVTSMSVPFLTLHYVKPEHMADLHRLAYEGGKESAFLDRTFLDERERLRVIVREMVASLVHARQR